MALKLKLKGFLKSTIGATAIEYGLIAAFIALVTIGSLILFSSSFKKPMEKISDTLSTSTQSSGN